MATTNIQTFSGDVEIVGGLSVTGTVTSTVGTDKVNLAATTTNETDYIPVSKGATGAQALYTDSNLTYNPSTNQIGANISGNAAFATNATFATSATHANAANTVAFTDRDTTSETDYIAFVSSHVAGDYALYTDSNLTYNPSTNQLAANLSGNVTGNVTGNVSGNAAYANNAGTLGSAAASTGANASSIAQRDSSADIACRLLRPNYANANTISGAMAYRINNSTDNYVRFCSDTAAIRTYLNVPTRTGGNASGTWGISVNGSAANISSANATMPAYIKHAGDTNTYFGFVANDTYVVATDGGERVRVASDGNVGIGTNAPAYKLDVNGTVNTGALTATSATVPNDGDFVMGGKPLKPATGLHWDRTNSRLGVGTGAPAYTLDVTGTARFTGAITGNLSGNVTGNVSGNAAFATNATFATTSTNSTHANAANTVAFTARNATNNTDYIAFVDTATAGDKALFTDSNLTYNSSTNHINANVPYANAAGSATNATFANVSTNATYADNASNATYANSAGSATNASYAVNATFANVSTNATYANNTAILNGYEFYDNGLGYSRIGSQGAHKYLINWGATGNIGTGQSAYASYRAGFGACYSVIATRIQSSGANSFAWSVGQISNSGFRVYSNGAVTGQYYWIAVGR